MEATRQPSLPTMKNLPPNCNRGTTGHRRAAATLARRAIADQKTVGHVIVDRATVTEVKGIAVRAMVTAALVTAALVTVDLVTVDPAMVIAVLATGVVLKTVVRARVDRQTVARRPDVGSVVVSAAVDSVAPAVSAARCREWHGPEDRWQARRI